MSEHPGRTVVMACCFVQKRSDCCASGFADMQESIFGILAYTCLALGPQEVLKKSHASGPGQGFSAAVQNCFWAEPCSLQMIYCLRPTQIDSAVQASPIPRVQDVHCFGHSELFVDSSTPKVLLRVRQFAKTGQS